MLTLSLINFPEEDRYKVIQTNDQLLAQSPPAHEIKELLNLMGFSYVISY